MRAQTIQVQNEDSSHRQWLSQGEIDRAVARKEIYRITRRKESVQRYRMISYPDASTSHATAASITPADARALAGLQKVNEIWIERLIGFKLLREGTLLPECGYL